MTTTQTGREPVGGGGKEMFGMVLNDVEDGVKRCIWFSAAVKHVYGPRAPLRVGWFRALVLEAKINC